MKSWICIAALVVLPLGTPAMADEIATATVETAAATLQPNRYVWDDPAAVAVPGMVSVVISIPDQRAYVYRGEALVAASAVSTGKKGKATPVGMYTILEKKVAHNSNIYNNASMPFMQRLTWNGIAIHAGQNPGFPNSHGCIRVPAEFAKKLFNTTALGTTVMVTDQSAASVASASLVSDKVLADARTDAGGEGGY